MAIIYSNDQNFKYYYNNRNNIKFENDGAAVVNIHRLQLFCDTNKVENPLYKF